MRRRPLLRTAAVAGTAAYVGHKVTQQNQRMNDLEAQVQTQDAYLPPQPQYAAPPAQPQYAAPPAPPPAESAAERMEALNRLGELRRAGVLTEEEFAREKQRILAG